MKYKNGAQGFRATHIDQEFGSNTCWQTMANGGVCAMNNGNANLV
jgi:hypothetical protein